MDVQLTNHHLAIRYVETPERVEFQGVNEKPCAKILCLFNLFGNRLYVKYVFIFIGD